MRQIRYLKNIKRTVMIKMIGLDAFLKPSEELEKDKMQREIMSN